MIATTAAMQQPISDAVADGDRGCGGRLGDHWNDCREDRSVY